MPGEATLAERLSDAQQRARVDELCAEARAARHLDPDRLLRIAEEAFELACCAMSDGRQYSAGMAACMSLFAAHSRMFGRWQDALAQSSQALALIADSPPGTVLCDIYETMGWTFYYMGDYVEAMHHLMKACRIACDTHDASGEAYALDKIASVQAALGQSDTALETHARSLALHRELGDREGEALALNNVAYAYMDLGDIPAALRSARSALSYALETNWTYLLMGVYDTLADIHLRTGELDSAEEYAQRNVELCRAAPSPADETSAMITLGRIARARGELQQAIGYARSGLDLAEQTSQLVEQYRCHEILSEIYESIGDHARALDHFKRFHELKQRRLNGETDSRLANLRVEHEVESARKDAEIQRLRSLALEREVEQRKIAHARLEAQASLDPLTRLYNRRHLPVIAEALREAIANNRTASLLMLDIDRFKSVNDVHGHVAGDAVLVTIAHLLSTNARKTDTPCRYGGDEFLVLLLDMDHGEALSAAERLRSAVERTLVSWQSAGIPVTISVGVASVSEEQVTDLDGLIELADRALYAAKQSGRNKVVSSES